MSAFDWSAVKDVILYVIVGDPRARKLRKMKKNKIYIAASSDNQGSRI